MNPTKSLVTGAVALTAFASVLGIAYAQVENQTEATQPTTVQHAYPTQATDPAQPMPADQQAAPMDQATPEAQSQQSTTNQTPEQQWQSQTPTSQQDPLPTEPTSAGAPADAPAPRADRN